MEQQREPIKLSPNDRIGFVDMRGGFVWPNSVLCGVHATQANVDRVVNAMLAINTTAFPRILSESDRHKCVICGYV